MNHFPRHNTQAFSLVEVAIALGIAAFCLVVVFGLLPVGVNTNQASIEQTSATNVASAVALDLQAIPTGSADPSTLQSPLYKIPAPPASGSAAVSYVFYSNEDGKLTSNTQASADSRYRVTITYNAPASGQIHAAVPTQILVTWPAQADATASTAPKNYTGAVEVDTLLLRE